jgi:hypothetical protein
MHSTVRRVVTEVAFWGTLAITAVALIIVLWQARRALLLVASGIAAALIATWLTVFILVTSSDENGTGAGAAFDCATHCSLYQDVIAVAFVGLPIMLVVVVVATGAIAVIPGRTDFGRGSGWSVSAHPAPTRHDGPAAPGAREHRERADRTRRGPPRGMALSPHLRLGAVFASVPTGTLRPS